MKGSRILLNQVCFSQVKNSHPHLRMSKLDRIFSVNKADLPSTYTSVSAREELLLNYIANFETTFLTLNPSRKQLLLAPHNECGVRKFLPTTLRPAILADPTLCDASFLAKFVANSVSYESLEHPHLPPDYIVSPQTTLEWQTGDCFDLSILLASLLIGAGYNAYVCIGYADKFLTEQQSHLQVADSCEPLDLYANYTVQSFAAEAAFSKRPIGIYKVDARYCREVNDTHVDKRDFTAEGGLLKRLHSPSKDIENIFLRCGVQECQNERAAVNADISGGATVKNPWGLSGAYKLLTTPTEMVTKSISGCRYVLSGGAENISMNSTTNGCSLIVAPETETDKEPFEDILTNVMEGRGAARKKEKEFNREIPHENALIGGLFKNKYLKPKNLVRPSVFDERMRFRNKLALIGASEKEVESLIIEDLRSADLLKDVLVPGKAGIQQKQEQDRALNSIRQENKLRIQELTADPLNGQRVYAWVYVAPTEDLQLGSTNAGVTEKHYVEEDINSVMTQAKTPATTKSGFFIDPASGSFYTMDCPLFQFIEAVFNQNNYFVNLQVDKRELPNDYCSFDFYNIDNWCICLMTQELVDLRARQLSYLNKNGVTDQIVKQVGGNQRFLSQLGAKGARQRLEAGIKLPKAIQDRQNQLKREREAELHQQKVVEQGFDTTQWAKEASLEKENNRMEALKAQYAMFGIGEQAKKYLKRWDSVEPIEILLSSLPAPWSVATSLSELRLAWPYPRRVASPRELIALGTCDKVIAEKAILYSDCFFRLYPRFNLRSGCIASIVCRPRPVYMISADEDMDVIDKRIVAWRLLRIQLFSDRHDKLSLRTCQYEINHEEVQIDLSNPEIYDYFTSFNDGGEMLTLLDTYYRTYVDGIREFPIWCYLGEELDEMGDPDLDEKTARIIFTSSFTCFTRRIKKEISPIEIDQGEALDADDSLLKRTVAGSSLSIKEHDSGDGQASISVNSRLASRKMSAVHGTRHSKVDQNNDADDSANETFGDLNETREFDKDEVDSRGFQSMQDADAQLSEEFTFELSLLLVFQKQFFDYGRSDYLKQHVLNISGEVRTRKLWFYPGREDSCGFIEHLIGRSLELRYYDCLREDGLSAKVIAYELASTSADPLASQGPLKSAPRQGSAKNVAGAQRSAAPNKGFSINTILFESFEILPGSNTFQKCSVSGCKVVERFANVASIDRYMRRRRRKLIFSKDRILEAETKQLLTDYKTQGSAQSASDATVTDGTSVMTTNQDRDSTVIRSGDNTTIEATETADDQSMVQNRSTSQASMGERSGKSQTSAGQSDPLSLSTLENEDALTNLDLFEEFEANLSRAAYRSFQSQRLLFSHDVGSYYSSEYDLNCGVTSLLSRHEALLEMAYHLSPEILKATDAKKSADDNPDDLDDATADTERVPDNDTHKHREGGPGFWLQGREKKADRSRSLNMSLLSRTTADASTANKSGSLKELLGDVYALMNTKNTSSVPAGVAALYPTYNLALITDNELSKTAPSFYIKHMPKLYDSSPGVFNYLNYVNLLKSRELPILPHFDTTASAIQNVGVVMKRAISYDHIRYDLLNNYIEVMESMVRPHLMSEKRIFNKQSGEASLMMADLSASDSYTAESIRTAVARQDVANLGRNILLVTKELGTIDSSAIAKNQQKTIANISDEYTQVSSREKWTISNMKLDYIFLLELFHAVECKSETKLPESEFLPAGNSVDQSANITVCQTLKSGNRLGLKFSPRDLEIARHALKLQGTQDRFEFQTTIKAHEEEETTNTDYLYIYLPDEYKGWSLTEPLPQNIAMITRGAALDALRTRLVERASIISSRMEAEAEHLKRRRAVYNKSSDQISQEDRDALLNEIRECVFRIDILEMRSRKHEEDSIKRFAELENKLRRDPRLSSLNIQ